MSPTAVDDLRDQLATWRMRALSAERDLRSIDDEIYLWARRRFGIDRIWRLRGAFPRTLAILEQRHYTRRRHR